jgi:NADPH-dependent 2,4-dienoyl-CoA reductase/sulfur reductase-like enzyme
VKELPVDAAVIGGGAAGMAAALAVARRGARACIIERDEELGGILLQCIHNGFGLHEHREDLTGPEYAERAIAGVREAGIGVFTRTTVGEISTDGGARRCICYSAEHGVMKVSARAIVLAMGCRERNRGNLRIPGARPAGVYTAGLVQRLTNIEGYIPGREIVIIGSGDIGLIMARRLQWLGCRVHAVVEIMPYPSGLTRNIVQCLNDFSIPLYLSHVVSRIHGNDRVSGVDVMPIRNGAPDPKGQFHIPCDTVLLSVGLIPENELSKTAGVAITPATNGPVVDATMMTSVEGVFATGNVLHVHDLVDNVTEESRLTGGFVADYLDGKRPDRQLRVKPGSNVRYVNPSRVDPGAGGRLYLRPLIVKNKAELAVRSGGTQVRRVVLNHVQPSEMISLMLRAGDMADLAPDAVLEVSLS